MAASDPRTGSRGARAPALVLEGARHLRRHLVRSALTAATCAVAIAVTVNVISLVYGMDEDVRRDVARFGRLTVDVSRFPILDPRVERKPLGPVQLEEIRAAMGDLDVTVVPRRHVLRTTAGDTTRERMSVVGVPPRYLDTLGVGLAVGRWFTDQEPSDEVCVLDANMAATLFPDRPAAEVLGRTVEIDGEDGGTRRVLGILEDPMTHRALFESFDEGRGARMLTSTLLSFRNVYVPLASMPGDEFGGISVAARSEEDVDEVADRLRTLWPVVGTDLFDIRQSVGVFVRKEWMDLVGASTQTGALLGNIVWIIIVLVAVVMLSTLNLVTIRERYDELAIRRVEGARRRDVALQVTAEGTITALIGGLAGLPLGYVGAALLRRIVDFPFRFEVPYAIAATGVAILLGLLASVLPARRAAGLQPARVLSRRLT